MLSPDSFRAERCCDIRPSPKTVSFAAISFHSSTGSILSQADLRAISTAVRPIFADPTQVFSIVCNFIQTAKKRRTSFS